MNEVNYFAKYPNFLKKYLHKKKIYFLISVRFRKKNIILWMK